MQYVGHPRCEESLHAGVVACESLRAHGSSTVVSCFACACGSCCLAAVGSGWLSLSPLVFAFLDSRAAHHGSTSCQWSHPAAALCPAGRAPTLQADNTRCKPGEREARTSPRLLRGLGTTVVRPHGQRARAVQDLVGCGLRSDRSGNMVKQARDEFMFGLAILALVQGTGLQLGSIGAQLGPWEGPCYPSSWLAHRRRPSLSVAVRGI